MAKEKQPVMLLDEFDHAAFDMQQDMMKKVMQRPDVSAAIKKARMSGVPMISILVILLPFVLQLLGGGTLDVKALIEAILALIGKSVTVAGMEE